MKHILFYATGGDIMPALQKFEANSDLKYIEMGKESTPNRKVYLSYKDIPSLGVATQATGSASKSFLVSLREAKNRVYVLTTKQGQRRWLLSNGDNEDTVVLTPSGVWKTGTLLPGRMTTLHEANTAQKLMQWYFKALQQERFTMIDVWWVGPQALDMLKAGHRLAQAEQSPPELNLKLPV